VTTEIHFAYGHRLLDYDGKCAHPHGHNARVEVELESDALDGSDMVVDFGILKHAVQDWVDANVDHQMILRRDDPLVALLGNLGEPTYLMEHNPTAEALARLIYDVAVSQSFPVRRVCFWESPTSYATFEPSQTAPNRGATTTVAAGVA
jgi:6-pyruvoyltetrahydropterin/6-carboxytetrahydropterin synthase